MFVEVGAGRGAITSALAKCGADVVAVELDPDWAGGLRRAMRGAANVRVVQADILDFRLPERPFRLIGNIPFGRTTDILRRFLDDPGVAMTRMDVIVQWEVAAKRGASPPSTLLSTTWAPWWEARLGRRIPASAFRPRPRSDAGVLTYVRREPALLPVGMAAAYGAFVRQGWPFGSGR